MDVGHYLTRIQVAAPISIDLKTLAKLQLAHLKAVPFENLDIHYGKHITLDLERFYEKIVIKKRGGFCYEINGLFHALLCELGFNAKIISARTSRENGGFAEEYNHLAIVVTIDETDYLVDAGFGRFAIAPLKIDTHSSVFDGTAAYQISKHDDDYFKVSRVEEGADIPEYIFTLTERRLDEFAEMCEFQQTSPDSHFTQNKIISILKDYGRITLTNTQLKILRHEGIEIADFNEDQFEKYLAQYFDISMS